MLTREKTADLFGVILQEIGPSPHTAREVAVSLQ
jgi:hypothetical protein